MRRSVFPMKRFLLGLALAGALVSAAPAQNPSVKPVRLAIVGLVHDHVNPVLDRLERPDVAIVGVAEANEPTRVRLQAAHRLPAALLHADFRRMLDEVKPEAVAVFTSIEDHLEVIRACAERGIDVMVEKPLAVNGGQAREIARLAAEHRIQVLTNYETSWYPTTQEVGRIVRSGELGDVRKMIARDGHQGPKEIGVSADFLAWLTDPKENGGGAIVDFGCYGANLMTWVMSGEKPVSVFAVTQQLKSDPAYAKVDDEATIVLTYPHAQGIIQASWNWPYNRKDFDVYGTKGLAIADDRTRLRRRSAINAPEQSRELSAPAAHGSDGLAYLAAVVRGLVDPSSGLSALPLNVTVVEILDAARESARTGRVVKWPAGD